MERLGERCTIIIEGVESGLKDRAAVGGAKGSDPER